MNSRQTTFDVTFRTAQKPILKWAGGKSSLLPVLRDSLPKSFEKYCEPFVGGGALFWDLAHPNSIISDSNLELIHFYTIVRDYPGELFAKIGEMTISEVDYYQVRSVNPQALDDIARAARFIYLNKTCYNGLYRVNRKGGFNTPFGKKIDTSIVDENKLYSASLNLKETTIIHANYIKVLDMLNENDFVYLDPPYMPISKFSDFNRYTKDFFTYEDHVALANNFKKLTQRGVKALLSNSFNDLIIPLYRDYCIKEIHANRQINCKPSGRGKIRELLISNYELH